MTFFFRISLLLTSLVLSQLAWADEHQALNRHYQQFITAFTQLDAQLIDKLYADNACYLPEGENEKIILGKSDILALHQQFFHRIKQKNAHIDMDFRVVERQLGTDKATDVGYFLVRFHPAAETGEAISEFAGKFVTVLEKHADKQWYLTVDSSHKAEPNLFFSAKQHDKLYYGDKFIPLSDYANHESSR